MEEYRDLFLAEAQEYLQDMTSSLLSMEKNTDDEQLTEMFRAAHSLKGMAGTMGYGLIADVTHEMESLLDQLRTGKVTIDTGFVNMLFEAVDLVQLLVENLDRQDDFHSEAVAVLEKLRDWQARPLQEKSAASADASPKQDRRLPEEKTPAQLDWKSAINEFEKELLKDALSKGERIYHVYVRLLHGSLLKSVRSYMVLRAVEKQGEVIKSVPSLQALDEENFGWEFSLLVTGSLEPGALKKSIENIAEIESASVTPVELDSLPESRVAEPYSGKKPEKTATSSLETQTPSLPGRRVEKTVRVETAKLDGLVNLVGELIINRTRVIDLGKETDDEQLVTSLEQLQRITTELQSAVMTLRMVPIKQVFDRFPRMIRDLSLEKNKEVELLISGEETELDRTIVNQMGDPLVHLLRNAVDHGLEDAEERIKKGKNPVGKIFLEAHHEGSHVVVSVRDDGRGMDPQAIKERALMKKIISEQEAEKMSDEEALHLIFRGGFSTSEKITDVSGRGVGMDVVKTSIEALNGTVEIKNYPGKGSRFTLRFPLTLAIIRALMVKCGKEIYAIPIEAIRENLFVEPQEIKTIRQGKVITLREEVLPLYSLQESLGMGSFQEQEIYSVVIIQTGEERAGFIVDDLLGQQEVVIKSLGNYVNDIKGIAGATVLGDGRVTLILDVASLLDDGRVNLGKKSVNC
ncbi:MAG: chemotaxis protein CheA [Firmicutes bacterium]|nr:chemotaxis protein CheA [Bacillota bacterium]